MTDDDDDEYSEYVFRTTHDTPPSVLTENEIVSEREVQRSAVNPMEETPVRSSGCVVSSCRPSESNTALRPLLPHDRSVAVHVANFCGLMSSKPKSAMIDCGSGDVGTAHVGPS